MSKLKKNKDLCPCSSGLTYTRCCAPLHEKKVVAQTALQLMRSRYAAYKLSLADYIIATTHPQNAEYRRDSRAWLQEISDFSQNTEFQKLEIVAAEEFAEQAFVTFIAHLRQKGQNCSFREKSAFVKVGAVWFYLGAISHQPA